MGKKGKSKSSFGGQKKVKRLNPFEVHTNRVKHDVLGRRSKFERGLPGVARSKAIKKRDKTLLQEYKSRNKSNVFVDRRIGENDSAMDPEKKIALRIAAEKKRQFGKKSLFNLNEDEELTHGGLALNDSNLNDKLSLSDDEDEGKLDAQFVKEQHFGGFLTRREYEEGDTEKHKTKKEWIDEIIAESKRKKAEFKKEKEEQHEAVSNLDSKLQNFMMIMAGYAMTDEDKQAAKTKSAFRDYDMLVKELGFDRAGKAKPVDKLKTPEEIAKEEREKLEKLEADRVRRMKGEEVKDVNKMRSADDLDDQYILQKDIQVPLSYKDGKMLTADDEDQTEDESDDEKDDDAEDGNEEVDEDGEEEEGEGGEEEEDDDDESDKYSDILEESESEEEEEEIKEKPGTLEVIKKKEMMEAAKKELPYTFEVPQDYEAFWALLENHSPGEVNTILQRMIACNHPKLGGKNKEKCDYLCAYLLQTLNVLADYDGTSPLDSVSPLLYVDCITQHIYGLTQFTQVNTAKALKQVLLEKYGDCSKYKFKRYPMGDTFVFLKIAGMLFPSSDFIHPVMTPVMAFLCHLLGQGKISNRREVNAALFTAYLAYEYVSRSKRFMPELTNVLNGLLFMSLPMKNKTKLPITPPFKCIGPTASLLVPEAPVTVFESSKLTFASINKKDEEMTDDFKMNVLQKTVELLQEVCKCWSGLASVRAIMRPTTLLLDCLVPENLPKSVQEAVEGLRQAIRSLPAQGKPLVKEDARPKSIPMFEPAFEKIIEGVKKRHGSKEKLEHQKLLHNLKRERKAVKREIEKDTAYLARQKLQEQLASDAERKRKVGQIMGGLQMQESEHKKMKLKKK
ncbi:nucleolar protein 14-like [Penaeus chinensis]|uniref:nucleolar protein 14-like n=1 Tax=Penaeus chinensis TaxID=139456 RepID=UPI001FB628C1|nr:nucleolar protein 14-like [Penaeus chinensis]